ncbi:MAG: FAD-dependent oxidoreductase [Gammaproteobacteria bacterium]|nr:MAG: FAD-dependent oxidoreductase [Gammaproteobacteria bacterium]
MLTAQSKFPTDWHGWAELLPQRRTTAAVNGKRRVPWTVVGAGLTGLACARRLGELHPGQEILLLDARIVGAAASGRNSGFVVATSHFPGDTELRGIDNYRRINRINQQGLELLSRQVAQNKIDCQWARQGFYHTAVGEMAQREQGNFLRYLEKLKVEHEPLDRATLQALLGTEYYRTGTLIGDGALVQPAALVHGLADTLPNNVSLHENSAVLEIDEGKPLRLRLDNAEITTDKLILATNYEATRLGFLRSYIVGSTLAGSFTRVLTQAERDSLGSLGEWGAISLHSGGATLRLTRDHRISIRNTAEYHGSRLLTDAQLSRRQVTHRNAFEKRFPQLKQVPFEFFWSGVEGITRNGTNFFGRQRNNIYLAGGYNGSGVSRGTAFGNAIADYASGVDSSTVSDCLASAPAAWMPPRPLLDVAAFFTVRSRFRGVGLDR